MEMEVFMGGQTLQLVTYELHYIHEPFRSNTRFNSLILKIFSFNFPLVHSDLKANVLDERICWRQTDPPSLWPMADLPVLQQQLLEWEGIRHCHISCEQLDTVPWGTSR